MSVILFRGLIKLEARRTKCNMAFYQIYTAFTNLLNYQLTFKNWINLTYKFRHLSSLKKSEDWWDQVHVLNALWYANGCLTVTEWQLCFCLVVPLITVPPPPLILLILQQAVFPALVLTDFSLDSSDLPAWFCLFWTWNTVVVPPKEEARLASEFSPLVPRHRPLPGVCTLGTSPIV